MFISVIIYSGLHGNATLQLPGKPIGCLSLLNLLRYSKVSLLRAHNQLTVNRRAKDAISE